MEYEEPASQELVIQQIETLDELLELVNENHRNIIKPELNYADYIHDETEDDFDIHNYTDGEWVFSGSDPLSPEQVEADLEVLFTALRTTYGAYYYFGGDERFNAAKADILADFAQSSEQSCGQFTDLLLHHLAFIEDAHFTINGVRFQQPHVPWFYTETAYLRTNMGFVTADGQRLVERFEGHNDPEELLRLSISAEGELVYYPILLAQLPDDRTTLPADLVVHYTDGTSETLSATPWKSQFEQRDEGLQLEYKNGIPIIFLQSMFFDEAKDDRFGKEFLAMAQDLGEEPVVILDLRSNGGGNGVLPFKWLSAWCGVPVTVNHISFSCWSEADTLRFVEYTDNIYYNTLEDFHEVLGTEYISDTYSVSGAQPDMFADSDSLLIVLTSKNSASSAEIFTDAAQNVQNTLIVGENTFGMLVSNAYTTMLLPESGTAIQLGRDLRIFPENQFQEYIGYQPDLWVSGDAEAAVLKLLERLGAMS